MDFLIDNFKHLTTTPENVEQLKKLVLQMAVQGKLTAKWREQNPSVESASVLLEKIKTEKEQLIKEGKIKQQKAVPPVSEEEEPFLLPKNWLYTRLQTITSLITDGKHGDCRNEDNSGYYFLSAKDIQNGKLIYSNARQINKEQFDETHRRTNLTKGDLCVVNTGATVGKTAIPHNNDLAQKTTFQKSVAIVKPIKPLVNVYYLEILIKHKTPLLLKTSRGSAINNLLLGDMRLITVPLPPRAEQQAIVFQVEQLFTQIDQLHSLAQKRLNYREKSAKSLFSKINHAENDNELQETWQTLTAHFHTLTQSKESVKQLRQSILQMAVQGKLTAKWREDNPDVEPASVLLEKIKAEKEQLIKTKRIRKLKYLKDSISKDIKEKVPQKWVITNLGNVISYRKGKKPSILVDKKSKEYCIPYIDIKAFEKNIIVKYTNEEKVVRCSPDDILIVWDGARMGLTGTNASGALGSTLAKIEYYGILKDYLYLFFKSKYELINSNPKQAGLPHVNPGLLENMEFMFPCIDEQKAIVSKVKQLMAWCDELEKKIEKRDAYQEKMMQAVVKQAFKTEKESVEME